MLGLILQTGINPSAVAGVVDTLKQASAGIADVPVTTLPDDSYNLLSMVVKGGVMMIPLAILFLLSIYVMVERLIVLSRASKRNDGFVASIKDLVQKGNLDAARAMCKNNQTPIGTMIDKGISRIGQPMTEIREAMVESATVEIGKLEKNLSILNITGRIAPMFGFIGTIIGVIKIFYDIALMKTVEIEVISTGLYEKMVSSGGGLVVGVLAFILYHVLNARIDKVAHRMEEAKMHFLDILNEPAH